AVPARQPLRLYEDLVSVPQRQQLIGTERPSELCVDRDRRGPVVTTEREILDPATRDVIEGVPAATRAQVDSAVSAARRAFDSGDWKRATPQDRGQVLFKLAAIT